MAITSNYGAAPTYVKLASQTLSGASSSITFSNIPQGYTDLVLNVEFSLNVANSSLFIRLNGDSGTNYSHTRLSGTGSAASSGRSSSNDQARITADTTAQSSSTRQIVTVNFMNYSNSTLYKTFLTRYSSTGGVEAFVDLWRSTAAITSIQVKGFDGTAIIESGATFTLYGIKAALVPKASGGDIIVQDGTYWYHAFRTTNSFTPRQTLSCDVLVVAGGAGGGGNNTSNGGVGGGGGGAGGYRSTTSLSVSSQIAVTVGAGGAGGNSSPGGTGSNGSDSVFSTLTSTGGGGGGGLNTAGSNGGSGGGGYFNTSGGISSPVTSPVQGYAGGVGATGATYRGGGGGGASAAGVSATLGNPDGGAGSNAHSSWLSIVGLGVSGYLAGGGGGGAYIGSPGVGGAGGGGAGAANNAGNGFSASPNTGAGGGGAGYTGANTGGAGGSGLVIVRYTI